MNSFSFFILFFQIYIIMQSIEVCNKCHDPNKRLLASRENIGYYCEDCFIYVMEINDKYQEIVKARRTLRELITVSICGSAGRNGTHININQTLYTNLCNKILNILIEISQQENVHRKEQDYTLYQQQIQLLTMLQQYNSPQAYQVIEPKLCDVGEKIARIQLVAGGAAFVDHVAISLFTAQYVNYLDLALPAKFIGNKYYNSKCGQGSNRYHELFSQQCQIDSLQQLGTVLQQPQCTYSEYNNFTNRNRVVSNSEYLIAGSWGSHPTGGTLQTYNMYYQRTKVKPYYINLNTL